MPLETVSEAEGSQDYIRGLTASETMTAMSFGLVSWRSVLLANLWSSYERSSALVSSLRGQGNRSWGDWLNQPRAQNCLARKLDLTFGFRFLAFECFLVKSSLSVIRSKVCHGEAQDDLVPYVNSLTQVASKNVGFLFFFFFSFLLFIFYIFPRNLRELNA